MIISIKQKKSFQIVIDEIDEASKKAKKEVNERLISVKEEVDEATKKVSNTIQSGKKSLDEFIEKITKN